MKKPRDSNEWRGFGRMCPRMIFSDYRAYVKQQLSPVEATSDIYQVFDKLFCDLLDMAQ